MYRTGGLLVLLSGAVLVYLVAFTPFDEPVGRWTRPEQGAGYQQVKIECPSAWSALANGGRVDSHLWTDRDRCLRGARTHGTAGVLLAALSLVVAVPAVLRGPSPTPHPLPPLSELIRARGPSADSEPD